MLVGAQFFQSFIWNATVNINQSDSLTVDRMTGQVHACDIDFSFTEQLANKADDAGMILVEKDQEVAVGQRLDVTAVDAHDSVVVFSEQGATNRILAVGADHFQADQAGKAAGQLVAGLGDANAAFFGQKRSVDVVNFGADHWREDAFQGGHGQRLGRVVGHSPCIFNADFCKTFAIELRQERAKTLGQIQVGS